MLNKKYDKHVMKLNKKISFVADWLFPIINWNLAYMPSWYTRYIVTSQSEDFSLKKQQYITYLHFKISFFVSLVSLVAVFLFFLFKKYLVDWSVFFSEYTYILSIYYILLITPYFVTYWVFRSSTHELNMSSLMLMDNATRKGLSNNRFNLILLTIFGFSLPALAMFFGFEIFKFYTKKIDLNSNSFVLTLLAFLVPLVMSVANSVSLVFAMQAVSVFRINKNKG